MNDAIGEFCLINGRIVPVSELRNFNRLTDSQIYEVIRVENGVLLFIKDHLQRLKNTFFIVSWEGNVNLEIISEQLTELIKRNQIRSGAVKLLFFNFKEQFQIVFYQMQPYSPTVEEYQTGIRTISLPLERLNPNAKIWNESFRKRTNNEIKKNNVFEAILIDRDGFVTEGSRSNIFFVKGDILFTPPLENVLPGITRKNVLKVCKQLNVKAEIRPVLFKEINQFDAAFLTGTTRILVPISIIDDVHFNAKNHLVERIINGFKEMVVRYVATIIAEQ